MPTGFFCSQCGEGISRSDLVPYWDPDDTDADWVEVHLCEGGNPIGGRAFSGEEHFCSILHLQQWIAEARFNIYRDSFPVHKFIGDKVCEWCGEESKSAEDHGDEIGDVARTNKFLDLRRAVADLGGDVEDHVHEQEE